MLVFFFFSFTYYLLFTVYISALVANKDIYIYIFVIVDIKTIACSLTVSCVDIKFIDRCCAIQP